MYREIEGNLITLAHQGVFDVIAHGCNCFCKQKSGIARQMAENFGTSSASVYTLEGEKHRGSFNKLGTIQYGYKGKLAIVNCYTQYMYGKNHEDGVDKPIDYVALRLCMRKLNFTFKGKSVGLPMIGSGLAGGDWYIITDIIQQELKDCDITVVRFKNNA